VIGSIANIVAECKDYFSRSSLSRFCVNCVSPNLFLVRREHLHHRSLGSGRDASVINRQPHNIVLLGNHDLAGFWRASIHFSAATSLAVQLSFFRREYDPLPALGANTFVGGGRWPRDFGRGTLMVNLPFISRRYGTWQEITTGKACAKSPVDTGERFQQKPDPTLI